jgi:hypothetical protein
MAIRPDSAQRDKVIDRLTTGFAEGAIDTDEFERRVTVAHRSESLAEIEALVTDLPTPDAGALVPAAAGGLRTVVPAGVAPPRSRTMSLFGSTTRTGSWTVPRHLEVRAIFGNVELDFRDAVLPAGVIELDVSAVFGNIEITVPPHLAIEAEGNAILGNFDHVARAPSHAAPDAPLLRITGRCVFANVEVHMRLPGDRLGEDSEHGHRGSGARTLGAAASEGGGRKLLGKNQ